MQNFKLVVLSVLLSLMLSNANSASAAEEKKEAIITPELLSGGIVHNEGYFLPRGMNIEGSLRTPIDTRTSRIGDPITVQTDTDLILGDYNIIPAQSFIHGYVSTLIKPGKMLKKPKIEITFERVSIPLAHGERRELYIHGKATAKEMASHSKNVNDSMAFQNKARLAGTAGAAVGGIGSLAFTGLTGVYDTYGMVTMLSRATLLGSMGLGAVAGAAMVTRDDVRINTDEKLNIILEEASMVVSKKDPLDDYLPDIGKISPEDYDKFKAMQSEKI